MKIRNGFVSNSSSSSFLVIFPKEPKSMEDVKKMLFDEGQTHFSGLYSDEVFTVENVAETVWSDIKNQEKNDYDAAIEILSNGYYDDIDAPKYEDYDHIKDWRKRSELYSDAVNKYARKKANEFFNERKLKLKKINNEEINECVFYNFEYSDNDGEYNSSLEHSNLFEKLKHFKISNH